MKILIISPHPDDEVLGCGGTIANYSQKGDHITVCYVTKAYAPIWSNEYLVQKKKEIELSNSLLGITKRVELGYPAAMLDTVPQKEIADSLAKIILDIKPDWTFIPNRGDLNRDHQIVHDTSLVALRPLKHRCSKILSYETLSETEWGPLMNSFQPNYYIDITRTIEIKLKAMDVFLTEIKKSPHPRSCDIIYYHAKKRGSEVLVEAAEAFSVIRIIE